MGSPFFRASSSSARNPRTFSLLSRRRPSQVIDTSSADGEGALRTASASSSNVRTGPASSTASRYQRAVHLVDPGPVAAGAAASAFTSWVNSA